MADIEAWFWLIGTMSVAAVVYGTAWAVAEDLYRHVTCERPLFVSGWRMALTTITTVWAVIAVSAVLVRFFL